MSSPDAQVSVLTGAVNTWIVGDDAEVIVIDPGEDAEAVLEAVGERDVLAVICTHGHARHTAAAFEVAERDEAPIALHPLDRSQWRRVHEELPEIEMEEDGRFDVADVTLEVVHAPGHSRGSVLLYCEELQAVFTGDVVSETGPIPHEDGYPNWNRQLDAISAHILTLPAETRLLPGHGDELTVADAAKLFDSWASAGPLPVDGSGVAEDGDS